MLGDPAFYRDLQCRAVTALEADTLLHAWSALRACLRVQVESVRTHLAEHAVVSVGAPEFADLARDALLARQLVTGVAQTRTESRAPRLWLAVCLAWPT